MTNDNNFESTKSKRLSGIDLVNQLEMSAQEAISDAIKNRLAAAFISLTTVETLLGIERKKVLELENVITELLDENSKLRGE